MNVIKIAIPAIAIAAALTTAPASAIVQKNDLNSAVQSAVSPVAEVQVNESGGVATITGHSPYFNDSQAATQAALQIDGIESVINRMFKSHSGGK